MINGLIKGIGIVVISVIGIQAIRLLIKLYFMKTHKQRLKEKQNAMS
jgi:hypothetical protein